MRQGGHINAQEVALLHHHPSARYVRDFVRVVEIDLQKESIKIAFEKKSFDSDIETGAEIVHVHQSLAIQRIAFVYFRFLQQIPTVAFPITAILKL